MSRSVIAIAYAATGSSRLASLFFTLPTDFDTGHTRNQWSGHGRSSSPTSPSRSPSHVGQSGSPRKIGMRSCSSAITLLGEPVTTAQVSVHSPSGAFHRSQMPDHEVEYWTKRFGVSRNQLKRAV